MTYLVALAGAILQIAWILFQEKNKHDTGLATETWQSFFRKNWDDFAFALIIAFILVFVQDFLLPIVIHLAGWDSTEVYLVYNQEGARLGVSFLIGLFGTRIVKKLINQGERI